MIVYCVFFEEHGYYAKDQPTYEWCFTDDPEKANVYRSLGGAFERGEDGFGLSYGKYEIHEFVISMEYVGTHESQDMRAARFEEARIKREQTIAKDKHNGPDSFSLQHVEANKIRTILKASFGDDWRHNSDAKAALLQSDGFNPETVLLVMKEVV